MDWGNLQLCWDYRAAVVPSFVEVATHLVDTAGLVDLAVPSTSLLDHRGTPLAQVDLAALESLVNSYMGMLEIAVNGVGGTGLVVIDSSARWGAHHMDSAMVHRTRDMADTQGGDGHNLVVLVDIWNPRVVVVALLVNVVHDLLALALHPLVSLEDVPFFSNYFQEQRNPIDVQ